MLKPNESLRILIEFQPVDLMGLTGLRAKCENCFFVVPVILLLFYWQNVIYHMLHIF